MRHLFKRSGLALLLLAAGAQSVFGFALSGPLGGAAGGESWQALSIGYNFTVGSAEGSVDNEGPHNIAEFYRWNTPNLYYAADYTFSTYFGTQGMAAIDSAFAVLNDLTNYSAYPADLGDLPLTVTGQNFQAEALQMFDLKSLTLAFLMEELGAAQPQRFTWTLHDRITPAGAVCPNFVYVVVQRNFDPVTYLYSSYVNNVLMTYTIAEYCGVTPAPFPGVDAQTFVRPSDPEEISTGTDTAVAERGISAGQFYTGLSRDDIGALRYLMATNRMAVETVEPGSLLVVTNNSLNLLVTSNFATLVGQAFSNAPGPLVALNPGLVVNNSTQDFTNVTTTNITAYLTNTPFSLPGTPPMTVFVTNIVTSVMPFFTYNFGNVVTNAVYSQGYITTQTITTGVQSGSPAGSGVITNTNTVTVLAPFVNGEYFLLPPSQCGFTIVRTQLTTVIPVTNLFVVATNAPGSTAAGNTFSAIIVISYFTNHSLIVSIPACVPDTPSLRQGADKLRFFRHDYDSLLTTFWSPVTNTYNLTTVTSNGPVVQTFYRVLTRPDFLFQSADLTGSSGATLTSSVLTRSQPNFDTANVRAPLVGPGTIQPTVLVVYNKVGPAFENQGAFFVDSGYAFTPQLPNSFLPLGQFGTFDGSTNSPTLYPTNSSLSELENEVFLQIIISGPLTNGYVNSSSCFANSYNAQLQVSGFQPPFTWSVLTNAPGLPPGNLPPGLQLNQPATTNSPFATITGTPTTPGVYDFFLQVQDSGARTSTREFSIEVDQNPPVCP